MQLLHSGFYAHPAFCTVSDKLKFSTDASLLYWRPCDHSLAIQEAGRADTQLWGENVQGSE